MAAWAVTAAAAAPEGFATVLELTDMPDSTRIVARIQDGGSDSDFFRFDTAYVTAGRAEFRDVSKAPEPATMYLFTPRGTVMTFVQNGHNELIKGDASQIETGLLSMTGAPWSADLMALNALVGPLKAELNRAYDNYSKLSAEERAGLRAKQAAVDSLSDAFYRSHPNAWITLRTLQYHMMDMPRADVQAIYSALKPEQRQSRYGTLLGRYLSFTPIAEGSDMADYDFTGRDQNGRAFRLSDVKEPYVLLDFSSAYCGPCKMAAKDIAAVLDRYAGKVAFVTYSCDDSEEDWLMSVKRDSITWPCVFDGGGSNGDVSLRYGVNSYPTFFLFGPDRKLVKKLDGYSSELFPSTLDKLIGSKE